MNTLLGSQIDTFFVSLHEKGKGRGDEMGKEMEGTLALSLLIIALIPDGGSTRVTSFEPDYLLKLPSPNTITLGD